MNMIRDGLAWLKDELKANAGTTIIIRRGELRSEPITAVPGRTADDQYEEAGHLVTRARRVAWLIDPADYTLAGDTLLPSDEHTIEQFDGEPDEWAEDDEPMRRFEVTSPVPGQPPWRFTDAGQTMLRVDTLEV